MRIRLTIVQSCTFAERALHPNDVLDLNLATSECFVAAALPFNAGAILGLLAAGHANPQEADACEVRRRLTQLSVPSASPSASASPAHSAPRLRLLKG